MEFVATCAFGIEAVLKREMTLLGLNITRSENGKIYFEGNQEAMVLANLALRTAERIFIVFGHQKVLTYDELFDFIKSIKFRPILSHEGAYLIQAKTVQSQLFSPRDLQTITKKALIENLKVSFKVDTFLEQKERYRFLLNLQKDECELWLDTSGEALHKRGYRVKQGVAPIKETLAAALVLLSFYEKDRVLYDPFCGSGTIPIEAAMICKNMAPNLNRSFDFLHFPWFDKTIYKQVKAELLKAINQTETCKIIASDEDPRAVEMAEENAIEAGVDDAIVFQLCKFEHQQFKIPYGIIITNPPYGERLDTLEEAELLYRSIGQTFKTLKDYSLYMITSYPGIEGIFAKKADKTRVLFNGNIKARYYQYFGPRPPR
ncbi:THUMP domain-containing class I SAM-dependent RNA methyltransferase [Liberiplasma polymorphum]|uniref:THUMP domain-containing class I SAM-dependent RNA methyltransferase n=1 Tax=Liberiplasma polymorphum TaxID=3374570 RepID=UPI003771760F